MRGAQRLLEVLLYGRVGRWFEDASVQYLHRETPEAANVPDTHHKHHAHHPADTTAHPHTHHPAHSPIPNHHMAHAHGGHTGLSHPHTPHIHHHHDTASHSTLTRLIRLTITRVGVVEGSRAVEEVEAVEGSVGVVTEYRLGIDCQSSGRRIG